MDGHLGRRAVRLAEGFLYILPFGTVHFGPLRSFTLDPFGLPTLGPLRPSTLDPGTSALVQKAVQFCQDRPLWTHL